MAELRRPCLALFVTAVLGGCDAAAPSDPPVTISGSIEQVFEEPIVENSMGSVLVRHIAPDPNVGDLSIVHIRDDAHVFREEDEQELTMGFDQLGVGVAAEFLTTGYEKRTNPRQVIATRVKLISLP